MPTNNSESEAANEEPTLARLAILSLFAFATDAYAQKKVLIDTDPGVDDALAVLFAFASPELEVVGLTSIFGNVETELATANALRLLDIAGADVPVAEGAVKPIYSKKLPPPHMVHGKDGFGEINLPPSSQEAIDETAAEFIVRTVMENPGEITLVVLGPMTNIALALALEPELHENVDQVVAMGGVLARDGQRVAGGLREYSRRCACRRHRARHGLGRRAGTRRYHPAGARHGRVARSLARTGRPPG